MTVGAVPADPGDVPPDMIYETSEMVAGYLDQSTEWAEESRAGAQSVIDSLKDAKGPETLPDPPDAPQITTSFSATYGFSPPSQPDLGDIVATEPAEFTPDTIIVPDVVSALAPYQRLISGLTIPEAPVFVPPTIPTEPGIVTDFALPASPTPDYGSSPIIDELNLPSYVPPTLPTFTDAVPQFTELAPDPVLQWTEPVYASDVKTAVEEKLYSLLAGGTGIPPAIERAIWERARSREEMGALQAVQQVTQQWAAMGHRLPQGALDGRVIAISEATAQKLNELSRETAIEAAKLEQQNIQFAVQQGINYEQVFVGVFLAVVQRNFDAAKFAVETQLQVFNSQIALFNVKQAIFAQETERYKALLEGAFYYIKAFQAQVDAEKAKGELNMVRVQAFNAKVQAFNTQVEAYKAIVQSAAVKAELEKNKVEVYKARIEANVAQVQGQKAAFDAYAARVQAEGQKANLEEANARGYAAMVQGYAAKAEIALKQSDVNIQNSKMKVEYAVANLQRLGTSISHQLAAIQQRASVWNANTQRASAKLEADKAASQVAIQSLIEGSRLAVARYTASLEAWRTRAQQILTSFQINSESLRAAGQLSATLAAGAMASRHVSAGMTAGASSSNQTSKSTQDSTSFQQQTSDSNQYITQHNYNHEV